MIHWGILGAASIARRRLIPAIQATKNGQVTAVASRDPARARALADELSIPVVHESYDALLADPAIDAIYLPLTNNLHATWAIAAAAAGKHVLCEKPIALNAAEAETMVHAAEQAHVVLAEAFAYRFHPRMDAVLRLIREGAIGDLHLLRFAFSFGPIAPGNYRHDPALGGGALLDIGCYAVNFARLVCGGEPQAITALAHYAATGVDETFAGILYFDHGTVASFEVSMASQFGISYEVIGSTGSLMAPLGVRTETGQPMELHVTRGMEHEILTIEPADPYRMMVEDFADAILTSRPVRFGADDAVANMRVVDTLQATARSHAPPSGG